MKEKVKVLFFKIIHFLFEYIQSEFLEETGKYHHSYEMFLIMIDDKLEELAEEDDEE